MSGRMIGRLRALLPAALLFGLAAGSAAAFELTPAQTLLFDTGHMAGAPADTTLTYTFTKSGTREPGFTDRIEMTVTAGGDDAHRDASFQFLTGDNAIGFEPMKGFRGNPLIMLFLERDVREMKRLTGGSDLYFRNRIRYAFAADTTALSATTVTWEGRTVPATEVVIHPYVKDELIDRYRAFEQKEYRFVLSDAVPGAVYSITAETPGDGGAEAALRETMTLRGFAHAQVADPAATASTAHLEKEPSR